MKFSQHIGKGAWGFGSKLLPAIYGVVMIVVFRVLAKEEVGALALFQNIFAMLFTFSDSFALQAIVKFGVEPDNDLQELLTASSLLFFGFLSVALGILIIFPTQISDLLKNPHLPSLVPFLLLLVVVTIPRVIASKIFQMRFHTKELFVIDLINFGGASIIVLVLAMEGKLTSALDVIYVTIATGTASSLVAMFLARGSLKWRPRYSKPMLKRIFEFTRYQSATGAVHVLQQNLDSLLVSGFLGERALANYAAAKNFFKGFDVLRDTQGIFVFPATSKYYSRGDFDTLKKILEKAVSFLYMAVIPLSIVLIVGAPTIFHLIYGTKFDESIPVFRILMSAGIFLPFVMVGMASLVGMGKTKEVFRIILASLTLNTILSLILIPQMGLEGAAFTFCIAMLLQAVFAFIMMRRVVPLELGSMFFRGFTDAKNFLIERKNRRTSESS